MADENERAENRDCKAMGRHMNRAERGCTLSYLHCPSNGRDRTPPLSHQGHDLSTGVEGCAVSIKREKKIVMTTVSKSDCAGR